MGKKIGLIMGIILIITLTMGSVPSTTAYFELEGEWTDVNSSIDPGQRIHHDMVYMSNHSAILMFGGLVNYLDTGDRNDTWVFNSTLNSWVELQPDVAPDTRAQHAMAYDPIHDKVVLFSGADNDGNTNYNDTWIYDYTTNTWTNVTTQNSPQGRYSHGMIYDEFNGKILMYGGLGHQNERLTDTWYFDVESLTWEQLSPTLNPTANAEFDLSYDSGQDTIVLFGGANSYANQGGITSEIKKETWYFDPAIKEWNRLDVNNEGDLKLRFQHQSVYLPDIGVMVFGGYNPGTPDYDLGDDNTTMILDYDNGIWTTVNYTETTEILGISHFAMAFDNATDTVMMYGGQTNSITNANFMFNLTYFNEVIVETTTTSSSSSISDSSTTSDSSSPASSTPDAGSSTPDLELPLSVLPSIVAITTITLVTYGKRSR